MSKPTKSEKAKMTGGDSGQRAVRMVITPEIAHAMLEKNKGNRKPKPAVIARYAGAIRRGEWVFNGEAIKFSKSDRLVDGQNRLFAVIDADRAIDTMVVYGVDDDSQTTMDQGTARTLTDALKMMGEERVTILSGAIRVVYAFEQTGVPVLSRRLTVQEGLKCFKHNKDLRDSAKFTDKFMALGWISAPLTCGLHYLFSTASQEDADAFFTKLREGTDLSATNPIYFLRQRLQKAKIKKESIPNLARTAMIIKTWNAWMKGEEWYNPSRVEFKPGGANPDRFPDIEGVEWNNKPVVKV